MAELNGERTIAELDSGARTSILFPVLHGGSGDGSGGTAGKGAR